MKRYFFGFGLFFLLFMGGFVNSAQGATTAELEALIASLQRQIAELTLQLKEQQRAQEFCHVFNADLTFGSSGSDVIALKRALRIGGFDMDLSVDFNENAASGVVQFQRKHGIRQTGYVGPLTRAKLNALHGCSKKETVALHAMMPAEARVGEKVTLIGTGFTRMGNQVNLDGNHAVSGLESFDGKNLSFVVPEYTAPDCPAGFVCPAIAYPVKPGRYPISVKNNNGTSGGLFLDIKESKPVSVVPVIRSLSVSSGPVGSKITIFGSGFSLKKNVVLLRSAGETGAGFVASDVVASTDGTTLTFKLAEGGGYLCGHLLESQAGFACALLYRAFTPGAYKLSVASAPSELQSSAVDFTVTSAVVTPSISVTSPSAGETWRVGDTRRIAWKSTGIKNFKVYLVGRGNDGFVNSVELPNSRALSRSENHYDWQIMNQDIPIRSGSGLSSIAPSQFLDFYQIRIDEADGVRVDGTPVTQTFSQPFTIAGN